MPSSGLVRAYVVLWWTVGVVLFHSSVRTVLAGLESGSGHDPHLVLIGGVEALAALLFVFPRTSRVGAAGLLITFTVAFFIHVSRSELREDLLVYAAVVSFVAVHGPLPMSWLRRHA